MSALRVCLRLFLDWLGERHGLALTAESGDGPANALAAVAANGETSIVIEVHDLLEPVRDDVWLAHREQLEREIAKGLPGTFALWAPPGADLPREEAATADFVSRVRETATGLAVGERSYVALPVSLYLRRQQDEGGLVSVSGGLNRYWARLTEHVRGTYDLDSTRLHRLPESQDHLDSLFETIVARASELTEVGQWTEIETIDAWTLQRLEGEDGVTIVGRPPSEIGDVGLSVRRNFRRLLADACPRLRDAEAEARALVVLGPYGRMEDEGATIAMRGYDPTLYAGLDYVCLVADGLVKALLEART
ncbi:MAG: hypothetical protein WD379_10325 [Dehalococcoidia bacterium]